MPHGGHLGSRYRRRPDVILAYQQDFIQIVQLIVKTLQTLINPLTASIVG